IFDRSGWSQIRKGASREVSEAAPYASFDMVGRKPPRKPQVGGGDGDGCGKDLIGRQAACRGEGQVGDLGGECGDDTSLGVARGKPAGGALLPRGGSGRGETIRASKQAPAEDPIFLLAMGLGELRSRVRATGSADRWAARNRPRGGDDCGLVARLRRIWRGVDLGTCV